MPGRSVTLVFQGGWIAMRVFMGMVRNVSSVNFLGGEKSHCLFSLDFRGASSTFLGRFTTADKQQKTI